MYIHSFETASRTTTTTQSHLRQDKTCDRRVRGWGKTWLSSNHNSSSEFNFFFHLLHPKRRVQPTRHIFALQHACVCASIIPKVKCRLWSVNKSKSLFQRMQSAWSLLVAPAISVSTRQGPWAVIWGAEDVVQWWSTSYCKGFKLVYCSLSQVLTKQAPLPFPVADRTPWLTIQKKPQGARVTTLSTVNSNARHSFHSISIIGESKNNSMYDKRGHKIENEKRTKRPHQTEKTIPRNVNQFKDHA